MIYNLDAEPKHDTLPTRRETRKLERAKEFLMASRIMNEGHIANKKNYPGMPIFGLVDAYGAYRGPGTDEEPIRPIDMTNELDTHAEILDLYKENVENGDEWVVSELDREWSAMQPAETENFVRQGRHAKVATAAMDTLHIDRPVSAEKKTNAFFRAMAHRQRWLNKKVDLKNQ